MNDPQKFDWSEPRAVYGTMFAIASAILGTGYFVRDDAFTGSEGDQLKENIMQVERRVNTMYQRGPIEISQGQKSIKLSVGELKMEMRDLRNRDRAINKQLDAIEHMLREVQKASNKHYAQHKSHK